MPQPTPYSPSVDFSTEEANNVGGRSTVRTAPLDAELSAIAATLQGVLANLALNQRDDGEIRDQRVKLHTLSQDVRALLTAGNVTAENVRGAWVTAAVYVKLDLVSQGGNTYICAAAHTAGTFATDLAAGRWLLVALGAATAASAVPFTATATIAATNVQAAIEEADAEGRALTALASAAVVALTGDLASTASGKGDALIGVLSSATGAVARTQHDKNEETVSVKDFGAVGNGVADDTAAIVAGLAHLSASGGGTLFFPQGTYKTTAQITLPANRIRFVGTGKRMVYPGLFMAGVNVPSTIMPVHTGRNAFRFYSTGANGDGTFSAFGINLATLETGRVPTAAFGFDCAGVFMRDFTFEQCGIHGFTSAFDVYKDSGTTTEMGLFKALNCNINRNTWIARNLNGTQWNGFLFAHNEAGQNGFLSGQGGLDISAHACVIENNCMEGMRDPVSVTGGYRGVKISGNYFEANVGRACVELANIRGPYQVGPNTYLAIDDAALDQKVFITGSGMGLCLDPYWPNVTHKTNLAMLGADSTTGDNVLNNLLSSSTYGFCRVDYLDSQNYSREPQFSTIAYQRATSNARELNPQTGDPMPTQEYTTSGAGAVALSYTITGNSGEWVVMSWLLKQQPGSATANPYVSMSVNGTGAAGSKDYPIDGYTTYWRAGEWALITCAIKLGVAMTSLNLSLFPHGTTPTAGLVSRFLRPVVYTVDDVNKIIPFIDNYTAQSSASSPGGGTWKQGDWVHNSAVAAGGQSRYVCSVAGTPGTWVFG